MELGTTIIQVVAALVVTLALVFACAFVVRRFGGGGLRSNQVIKVLATAPIGSRERILLLEVHGRQLLIGTTANTVTALHVFDAGTPSVVATPPDFRSILKGLTPRS